MTRINQTHDASLTSWVESANGHSDFPIQNLPFASFRRKGQSEFRGGVAIGDAIVDLAALAQLSIAEAPVQQALEQAAKPQLNDFMAMGFSAWSGLRLALSQWLREGAAQQAQLATCLVSQADVEYQMPAQVGDYTDFYTSIHHATAVGKLFRPDNPLLPNYKWVPIGYHGRASSLDVSGQEFHRPCGQTKAPDAAEPSFGPCKRLDYELEMGIFVGKGNDLGSPIALDDSDEHLFGMCLFNDWSARDIQAWEYQPLGPFLSKSFASTISPWIVTMEALAPYRVAYQRPESDPTPLPYLCSADNDEFGSMDIELECFLQTDAMRETEQAPQRLSRSNFRHSYWTMAQMLAHHSVNGCNMRPGDLLGSGTQSGPEREEAGSLLELSQGGKVPLTLANGEQRTFLADGDTVIFKGHCQRAGYARIGFGEVVSTVLPAKS
ncbi:fumarylacetoacetase [Paraferrimonas sedimenticola]|uniref:fumarylacetoacetase n=1 Tax=Paraferrimonas sedimenticola TaxID=375674 RepID=A0AA37RYN4_9GAMM|nr:fumarylacetoacetase [Paraferrimonas sedimenticola]GLP97568.1 fumarylacetoacetase [Paraferrimonas sedimenticola]